MEEIKKKTQKTNLCAPSSAFNLEFQSTKQDYQPHKRKFLSLRASKE